MGEITKVGYRRLKIGDKVMKGDIYLNKWNGKWMDMPLNHYSPEDREPSIIQKGWHPCFRKITKKKIG